MSSRSRIGFMQGRLSPLVDGKIQAFPWAHWRDEFPAAQALGFGLIEWTLDHDRLAENPLMTPAGRTEIRALGERHRLKIASLTGDCFMQAPFYKARGAGRQALLRDLEAVLEACGELGIREVVMPLVDDGALTTPEEERDLSTELLRLVPNLARNGVRVVFESDYDPGQLRGLIAGFPAAHFGINYDIGNSAALGFEPEAEIAAYGPRILNVHVKDRLRGGTTVPLGTGNADLPRVLRLLRGTGYAGNYILQTARAQDGDHAAALCRYRDMVESWLNEDNEPDAHQ